MHGDDGVCTLIDGPSPPHRDHARAGAPTRPAVGPFEQLFNGEDAVSRVFLDVIQRDLVATLRQGLRQHAHLVSSV
jgi:hypothetical protein